jgi:endo-1,3(4)-beta-glucanase
MMPFTPITEQLLGAKYVSEEFPVIEPRLERVTDQWKGLIELARAVLDPEAAFGAITPLAANRIDGFDAGNSLTNSLYWVATRQGFNKSTNA